MFTVDFVTVVDIDTVPQTVTENYMLRPVNKTDHIGSLVL